MNRRLRLAALLLAALAVLAPALSAHACVDADCASISLSAEPVADVADEPCSDCGQACANGCCHAPHPVAAPDFALIHGVPTYAATPVWSHSTEPPLTDAAGPLRPPRA